MAELIKAILISTNFWSIAVPTVLGIYIFHKNKVAERESEWRKEKLKLYLNFVQSLSGITDSEISIQGEINFAKACNDLHALSPNMVLKALHNYQDKIRISNLSSTQQEKQIALDHLIWEIRKDLKLKTLEKESDFEMLLWTSGKKLEN
jgi:hypothetical protein